MGLLVFSLTYSTILVLSSRWRCVLRVPGYTIGFFLVLLAAVGAARAQTAEEFFRSHEITIVTSGDAGGGYDAYSRMLSRYMPRYLPGNPTVVVSNMPGGGG